MLDEYVRNHSVGESGQNQFVKDFIDAIGINLDGRLIELRSGSDSARVFATFEDIRSFVVSQIMSAQTYPESYTPYTEPFEVVEIRQPSIRWEMSPDGTISSRSRFSDALEGGRRNAQRYDDV